MPTNEAAVATTWLDEAMTQREPVVCDECDTRYAPEVLCCLPRRSPPYGRDARGLALRLSCLCDQNKPRGHATYTLRVYLPAWVVAVELREGQFCTTQLLARPVRRTAKRLELELAYASGAIVPAGCPIATGAGRVDGVSFVLSRWDRDVAVALLAAPGVVTESR